ncbi:hypothetical protein N7539_003152 [Penicillium diatomitis]|uniref:Enoyl reductase (ER) domain-containing protein n=1 Tax=Penicillium diatomitis TaxID=2819901 RepID=A0A9W9XG13_9EURO|nr:uncharacterized protein N7539_003152 [Penicillium diatomitis]KAJ5491585.1 hypothetical protein N7539_003152 [Penicillium diatomitis]
MRAWVRPHRGPAKNLQLTDMPTPAVPPSSSSEVLIRVSHVSVNFNTELFMKIVPKTPLTKPWIPEIEFSGEVIAAGTKAPPEVCDLGVKVIGYESILNYATGHGVLAEYVRVPGSNVVRASDEIDMASASGINGCGSCALKICQTAGIRKGHVVLVNGASGSVGSVLVQLCKVRGAKVVGVASGGNEEIVRGLGVDEFIDYRKLDSLPAYLASRYGDKLFDFILDCVGTQALYANSPAYLKPEGALINIGFLEGIFTTTFNVLVNRFLPTWLGGVPRRYITFSTPPTRDAAIYMAKLVEEGHIRIPIDSVYDMEDAIAVYERVATQRARGKVVIKVRSN